MHILITHAGPSGPSCQEALDRLVLPHLAQMLQRLTPADWLEGQANDLSSVPERVMARVLGLSGPDGLLPWAALNAHQLGLTRLHGPHGWAWITPCHWKVHADHVEMLDPMQLALTPKDSDALCLAMQPYFAEDGIALYPHSLGHTSTRWLAHGAVFAALPTASLDRVAGRTVDAWMPRQTQAKALRRLQNEMQMLLYTSPINDSRSRFNLPSVNAFWASGTGSLPEDYKPSNGHETPTLRTALRLSALQDDASAWTHAWQALDATTLAHDVQRLRQGEPLQLTLCGERQAVTFASIALPSWRRMLRSWQQMLRPLRPQAVLASL